MVLWCLTNANKHWTEGLLVLLCSIIY